MQIGSISDHRIAIDSQIHAGFEIIRLLVIWATRLDLSILFVENLDRRFLMQHVRK